MLCTWLYWWNNCWFFRFVKGVENGVEFGVLGRNRRPKERVPWLFAINVLPLFSVCWINNSLSFFLWGIGDWSSKGDLEFWCSLLVPSVSSREKRLFVVGIFWRICRDGFLFGGGGGEGKGRHRGVMGELIMTSVLLFEQLWFSLKDDLQQTGSDAGGTGDGWLWVEYCFIWYNVHKEIRN